jgi:hypothetical protein
VKYFQTDGGRLSVDDAEVPDPVPPEWSEITQEQYEALIAAEQQAAADAEAAVLAAANARWVTVHDDLVRIGASDEAAVLVANAVGIRPA